MLPKLHQVRLDNGFRAFLIPRSNLPVVASVIYYEVGSRDERTGETGLSHFLEHMMFKGTARYAKGEIDLVTSKLGGSNNAFTDNDVTAYYFALASDRWEAALEIEASRMHDCLLDPKEFEAEKSVVLEELATGEDDPWRMLWQSVEALAYQVHPYHHPVIGWKQDVERADVDAMRSYYGRHYGPNRAFLVAAGDLDVKRTTSRLEELFANGPPVAERAPAISEPELVGERRATIRAPGDLTRLALAVHTCRVGERDDFTLDLLAHVIGSGRSSRLYRRLVVQDEVATHVVATNETRLDPGLFWIAAELRPGADPERAEAAIREEIDEVVRSGVTAAELKRSRVQIRSSFLFEDETVLDLAMKIGRFEALTKDGFRMLERVLPTYDEIDRREIHETATRYFRAGAWAVVWSMSAKQAVLEPMRRRTRRKAKSSGKKTAPATAKKAAKKTAKKGAKNKRTAEAARKPARKPVRKPVRGAAATKRRSGDGKAER